eukprot:6670240-Lingulodinium_polyedra.AAC.1
MDCSTVSAMGYSELFWIGHCRHDCTIHCRHKREPTIKSARFVPAVEIVRQSSVDSLKSQR